MVSLEKMLEEGKIDDKEWFKRIGDIRDKNCSYEDESHQLLKRLKELEKK